MNAQTRAQYRLFKLARILRAPRAIGSAQMSVDNTNSKYTSVYFITMIICTLFTSARATQFRLATTASSSFTGSDDLLAAMRSRLDNVLLRELRKDPHSQREYPNRRSRAVLWGHYVETLPTPLTDVGVPVDLLWPLCPCLTMQFALPFVRWMCLFLCLFGKYVQHTIRCARTE